MAVVNRSGHITSVSNVRQLIKDFGTCLNFASTGIVTLGTTNPFSGDFYFSTWIKWSGPNGAFQHIFAKRDYYGASTMMFDLYIDSTTSKLSLDTNVGQNDFGYVFPVGQWVQLIWVRDTASGLDDVYINGDRVASIASDAFGTGTGALISIGGIQSPTIESFNGRIDEVAIGQSAPNWDEAIAISSKYAYTDLWTFLKLDEGSGSTATDSSGNGNNGTIDTATYATDKVLSLRTAAARRKTVRDFVTSLKFNGTSTDRVSVAQGTDYPIHNLTNFSVAGWFKVDPNFAGANYFWSEGASSGNGFVHIGLGDTTNRWGVRYRVRTDASSVIMDNLGNQAANKILPQEWNHFAVTDANGTVKIYLNGVLVHSTTYTRGTVTTNLSRIGCLVLNGTNSNFWKGWLDEMLFYKEILTLTQVEDIFYDGKYPSTNIVSFYKMDEGSGSTLNDETGNAAGTISGATYSTDVAIDSRTAI